MSSLSRSNSTGSVPYLDMSKLMFANDFDFGLNLNEMKTKTKQKLHTKNLELDKLQEIINQRLQNFDKRVHKQLESSATEKAFYATSVF